MKGNAAFKDARGNWSSARIGAFVIILVSLFLTTWVVIVDKEYMQASALFASMTGVAITLYILGKNQDLKSYKLELGAGGIKSVTSE